ncbi:MFS transporter [Salipaludibacillus sp. CF4.18]|uniref:MFS transporter n=1 Tax=Salipaludibacillus sp. CF4.18 TaxID=3373081 RepID=UPI003EE477A3
MGVSEENKREGTYHTAKIWQIAFFALNNTATNLFLFAIGFVTYYATGIVGLSVMIISTILTLMRVFDAFTDPIIGFIIDRTETKFGKFRPIMLIGNIILLISFLVMYNVTHLVPEAMQLPFFIGIYALYIIGYTLQTTVTRAAQTVLTNHPKQRPLFTIFDSVYNISLFTGGQIYISSYLVSKHGDFSTSLFTELSLVVVILAFVFTILAILAIKSKDRHKYYGLAEIGVKVRFRDYWPVLKRNRPLQMLVIAASTDKLAGQVMNQQVAMVMLFGIILGDFALSGTISLIAIVPSFLITYLGVVYARKNGLKRSLVHFSWLGVIAFGILVGLFTFGDPQNMTLDNIGIMTILFILLFSIGRGVSTFTPSIVIPMIADVSDYETHRTGRYVPGMIGALFSFIDKAVSSLAPAIVGGLVAIIGYRDEFPQLGESPTTDLFAMTMIIFFGIPISMWLISIIAMRFYTLDGKRMEVIQEEMAAVKNQIYDAKEKKALIKAEQEKNENIHPNNEK